MAKIEFKNYPDTSTPINAENLNAIQDNVIDLSDSVLSNSDNYEIINKKFIKVFDNIYIINVHVKIKNALTVGPRAILSIPQNYAPTITNDIASLTGQNKLIRIFYEESGTIAIYNLEQLNSDEHITFNLVWVK